MRILAVDYGDSRTGLAISDKGEILASPLMTVFEKDFDKCIALVAENAEKNGAELIVVGDPINMNGTRGPRSEKCRLFAEKLKEASGIEVVMWDERSTTVSAISIMNENNKRGKKRKEALDQAAAAIILESYLAYRKNQGGNKN
ncbi:MAG: Holliday junction resolvase RuvX [Oscillospiraceae bacterium]|nr:Holliday junction resolvase RuvX [Oscillospiraceae bacterium]